MKKYTSMFTPTFGVPISSDKSPAAIYVGATGDLSVVDLNGNTHVITGIQSGTVLEVAIKSINDNVDTTLTEADILIFE